MDGADQIGHARHRQIFQRARRGFAHNGGQTDAAALWDDHAMRARALCRADNRAQIVRVGKLVADDDQRGFAPAFRVFENFIDRCIGVRRDHGNDALMRARGRKLVELAPVGFHDGGSCFPCHGGQPCKGAVGFSGGDVKLVDGTACGKRLLYGVAALQHIFGGLRRLLRTAGRRAAVVPVPFFLFHSFSSLS